MKTAKEHYEEYIAKIGSSTINLRKLYEDAFEKGKESEAINFANFTSDWQPLANDKWMECSNADTYYTTYQLYQLYKKK